MKRLLLLIALCSPSFAACTGGSPTWQTTPDQASVASCIASASSGDTINVSSGSVTWTGSISFSGKNLIILGAGAGNTVITGYSIQIDTCNNPCRVSGFTWNLTGSNYMQIAESVGWRVDHNAFSVPSANVAFQSIGVGANPSEGLVDHNTDVYGAFVVYGESYATGGQYMWAGPLNFGTSHAVYFENNTINNPDGSTGGLYYPFVDGNTGCHIVARFNTIIGSRLATHGLQGESQDGCMVFEFYNNTFTQPATPNAEPLRVRGGTGFVFHNTSDGNASPNQVEIDVDRANEDSIASQVGASSWWEFCDGLTTSSYLTTPGNLGGGYTTYSTPKAVSIDGGGTGGYPCRDQLGRGTNASRWNYSGTPPAQQLVPAYIWRNTTSGSELSVVLVCETSGDNLCSNQSANIVNQNRDWYGYNSSFNGTTGIGEGTLASQPSTCTTGVGYWATDQGTWNASGSGGQGVFDKCTATNTWTNAYYMPYAYPHPLQGSSGAFSTSIQGTRLQGSGSSVTQ
jgi:hypothetical protein